MKPSTLLTLLLSAPALAAPAPAPAPEARPQQPPPQQRDPLNAPAARSSAISLNQLLQLITSLAPVGLLIQDIGNLLAAAETVIASTLGLQTTENDLAAASGTCADVTVLFARGTTEAGNVGVLVGPPFFGALEARLLAAGARTLAVQGTAYPASVEGFLAGGDVGGSQQLANDVTTALAACPNTKAVVSGYSQGGQLVHKAAALLPAATTAQVSAVVIFGDPDNGQAVQGVPAGKTRVYCAAGDNICQGGSLVLLPHLLYAKNADDAAAFVVSQAGF